MKKLMLIAALASFTFGSVIAQTAQPAPAAKQNVSATKQTPATQAAPEKKELKKVEMKKSKVLAADDKKMKSDGTPDMRYKENKAKKGAGPKKSDGTPDMRYKANKPAAAPVTK